MVSFWEKLNDKELDSLNFNYEIHDDVTCEACLATLGFWVNISTLCKPSI